MTRLTRESGSLLRAYRARLSREETDTDAEVRQHGTGSFVRQITWYLLDKQWKIVCSEGVENGHDV